MGKYIQKVPFKFNISYTDYVYSLSDIYREHDIHHIGMKYISEYFMLECATQLDIWDFNSNQAVRREIDLQDGMIRDIYINGT